MFDKENADDLLALKTEVLTDPEGYGYDPEITQSGVLDIINLKRPEITVSKPYINAVEIRNNTYFAAYNNLAIDEQEWIRWITSDASGGESLLVTQDLRDRLTGVLGGSATGDSIWAAADDDAMEQIMLDLIDISGSRAEDLFGFGTSISSSDWFAARDS